MADSKKKTSTVNPSPAPDKKLRKGASVEDAATGGTGLGPSWRILLQIVCGSPDAVMVTDLADDIVYVNDAFEALTGYPAAEALGKNPRVLQAGQTPEATYRDLWQTVLAGRTWRGRLVNVRKDGELCHEDVRVVPIRDEQGALTHFVAIRRDLSERRAMEEALLRLTVIDDLTGLNNLTGFLGRAEDALRIARRTQFPCLVILAAMDGMKTINQTLGAEAGDRAIQELAMVLRGVFRQSDVIGRIAGNEFAVLAFNAAPAHAGTVTARIELALQKRNELPDRDFQLSISYGVIISTGDHSVPLEELLAAAGKLMLKNKRKKKPT